MSSNLCTPIYELLYVQEVVTHLYSNLLCDIGHYFLDIQHYLLYLLHEDDYQFTNYGFLKIKNQRQGSIASSLTIQISFGPGLMSVWNRK